MELKNKRIVITGATSGIGRQLMISLSKYEETKIIAVGREMRNIPISMNIIPFKADISTKEGVDALFDFAVEKLGGIDIFIANAGHGHFKTYDYTSWEDIENTFKINTFSPIYSTKRMIEMHADNKEEFMIAITVSCIAKLPIPGSPIYVSTKLALDGFAIPLRYKFPPNGHLCTIYPVEVSQTNFFEEMLETTKIRRMPGKKQTPQKAAKEIIKGIKKNKNEIYTDHCFRIKLYFFYLFPFLFRLYSKRMLKKNASPEDPRKSFFS